MLGRTSEITPILSAMEPGDPTPASQLLPLVYDELRKLAAEQLAQESPGQTLQATALVHEAYLRLVAPAQAQRFNSRGQQTGRHRCVAARPPRLVSRRTATGGGG
jgi:hypothetical protein